MEIGLSVLSNDLDPERLHAAAMELRNTILRETDASVTTQPAAAQTGDKGDPITLGSLAVTFLTSGAAISIFKVLEAFVTKKRSIELEVSRPDGQKVVLRANDVSPEQLAATQQVFEKLLG